MAGKSIVCDVEFIIKGKVSPEQYQIGFVSNWVMREWGKHVTESAKILSIAKRLQSGAVTVENLSTEDKATLNNADNALDRKYALVKELLESNGYEFDHERWDRCVNPKDIDIFIATAANKDVIESKKKV